MGDAMFWTNVLGITSFIYMVSGGVLLGMIFRDKRRISACLQKLRENMETDRRELMKEAKAQIPHVVRTMIQELAMEQELERLQHCKVSKK